MRTERFLARHHTHPILRHWSGDGTRALCRATEVATSDTGDTTKMYGKRALELFNQRIFYAAFNAYKQMEQCVYVAEGIALETHKAIDEFACLLLLWQDLRKMGKRTIIVDAITADRAILGCMYRYLFAYTKTM